MIDMGNDTKVAYVLHLLVKMDGKGTIFLGVAESDGKFGSVVQIQVTGTVLPYLTAMFLPTSFPHAMFYAMFRNEYIQTSRYMAVKKLQELYCLVHPPITFSMPGNLVFSSGMAM